MVCAEMATQPSPQALISRSLWPLVSLLIVAVLPLLVWSRHALQPPVSQGFERFDLVLGQTFGFREDEFEF